MAAPATKDSGGDTLKAKPTLAAEVRCVAAARTARRVGVGPRIGTIPIKPGHVGSPYLRMAGTPGPAVGELAGGAAAEGSPCGQSEAAWSPVCRARVAGLGFAAARGGAGGGQGVKRSTFPAPRLSPGCLNRRAGGERAAGTFRAHSPFPFRSRPRVGL